MTDVSREKFFRQLNMPASQSGIAKYHCLYTLGAIFFQTTGVLSLTHLVDYMMHLRSQYTTSIKQPRFGNLSKFLLIVLMKISGPDSDLVPKH